MDFPNNFWFPQKGGGKMTCRWRNGTSQNDDFGKNEFFTVFGDPYYSCFHVWQRLKHRNLRFLTSICRCVFMKNSDSASPESIQQLKTACWALTMTNIFHEFSVRNCEKRLSSGRIIFAFSDKQTHTRARTWFQTKAVLFTWTNIVSVLWPKWSAKRASEAIKNCFQEQYVVVSEKTALNASFSVRNTSSISKWNKMNKN